MKIQPLGLKVYTRITTIATYTALLLGSAVYLLPFLWMVSGSLKDLETIFEYPPSILPMETLTVERGGKRFKLAEYTPENGAPTRQVLLRDQRKGEYLAESAHPAHADAPEWVPAERVRILKRVHFRFGNYAQAWTAKPFTYYTLNTLIITLFCIVGQVLSASLVAFAFARLEWPGRKLLFGVVLATMMLPAEVTMIPTYIIFRSLGWIDTFLPLIVPAFLGGGAFFIFLFRQFFLTLPRELDEAARVDGCSSLGIYLFVLMPLCKPIIATIAVLSFVAHWNDFLTPLIYLNSTDKFTLALGLRFFQGAYTTDMHLLMAASTLALLPVIAVFFLGQKYFVRSIVLTGTKG
ncbi:MAG TPA: carbohydrate ABC transporter permease [Chthonomonadales bacterium]|nr:carbohydrate ABC transporter permease [Chthonomonadales bacterium]